MRTLFSAAVILIVAVVMAMTGRGGGNFYVPVLIIAGYSVYRAATTAQLILATTAIAALLIFQKYRTVDWKLALVIDPPTDIMAFFGGYWAHIFNDVVLKFIFAGLLVGASFLMLYPIREKITNKKRFGFWHRQYRSYRYTVNLWLAIPVTAATGFVAGMVGISGGSFKVPLMVLACGVPMRIAVGTSSAMVAATALMGFFGHTISGDFDPSSAILLITVAAVGGLMGSKFSLKTNPKNLKRIFAFTTIGAAVFMVFNALLSIQTEG